MIYEALKLAKEAHAGQTRKYTNTPYVLHPIRVAGMVMAREDCTQSMIAAALLHDVLEDTEVPTVRIQYFCSAATLHLVLQLTNTSKKEYPHKPRAERKAMDRARLANVSRPAKVIKMCDRLDNLREMCGAEVDFRRLYARESLDLICVLQDADPAFAAQVAMEAERLLKGAE